MAQRKIILRDKKEVKKWLRNILMFTAPALAVFFYQLSQGVELRKAIPLFFFTLYALVADYLKKLSK